MYFACLDLLIQMAGVHYAPLVNQLEQQSHSRQKKTTVVSCFVTKSIYCVGVYIPTNIEWTEPATNETNLGQIQLFPYI